MPRHPKRHIQQHQKYTSISLNFFNNRGPNTHAQKKQKKKKRERQSTTLDDKNNNNNNQNATVNFLNTFTHFQRSHAN